MERTLVIPLGTGGGVIMGPQGDTNFAVVPDVDPALIDPLRSHEANAINVLAHSRYWLIDCGPQTAAWLCGGDRASGVTPELSTMMIKNLWGFLFTHGHTDHMGGLPLLLWRFIFVEKIKPIVIAHYELEATLRRVCDEIRYWNGAQLTSPTMLGRTLGREFLSESPKYQERYRPELEEFLVLRWATTGLKLMEDYSFNQSGSFYKIEFFRVDHNIDGLPAFGIKLIPHGNPNHHLVFSGDSARPISGGLLSGPETVVFHDCQTYDRNPDTAVHCHLDWLREALRPVGAGKRVFLVHSRTKPEFAGTLPYDECFEWPERFQPLVL